MKINNRRYTGSKYKLMPWIKEKIIDNCKDCHSFVDIFAGTGIVTAECLDLFDSFVVNDLLFSNEIIYIGFFGQQKYSNKKITTIANQYKEIDSNNLSPNYVSDNFGNKYFSLQDSLKIGYIREDIERKKQTNEINKKEYCILLASLLYSFDKCANTVGHYEAYIKNHPIKDSFIYELIEPLRTEAKIKIYRQDANSLARKIKGDIVFVDPPYSSRQYSRFYHLMETITKWDKPKLMGVAMKPQEENMSEYCRNNATNTFNDLITHLDCKYIVTTYNNTYDSKSSSSENKIKIEDLKSILQSRGKTISYEQKHNAFNAGKTEMNNHKEYLFITEVENG